MQCWICARQARGFGHADVRFPVGHPRRYPIDWVFCSMRCQACFHRLYRIGIQAVEASVIDPTPIEIQAMQQCLKPLGEAASEIGIDRPLSSYSAQEAMTLIEAVVTAYVEAMAQAHEQSRHPPLRMNLHDVPASGH